MEPVRNEQCGSISGPSFGLVHATWSGTRMLVEDHGAWAFAGDPCDPDETRDWSFGRTAQVGGRIYRANWSGTPTEDADGDGLVEETLFVLALGH